MSGETLRKERNYPQLPEIFTDDVKHSVKNYGPANRNKPERERWRPQTQTRKVTVVNPLKEMVQCCETNACEDKQTF